MQYVSTGHVVFYRHVEAKIWFIVIQDIRKYLDTDSVQHVAGTDTTRVVHFFILMSMT